MPNETHADAARVATIDHLIASQRFAEALELTSELHWRVAVTEQLRIRAEQRKAAQRISDERYALAERWMEGRS